MSVEATGRSRIATTALLSIVLLLSAAAAGAQEVRSETRDPGQSMDQDFAKSYASWISDVRYGSPLVDHLPAVSGIPTPKDVLGHHIGAPKTLTYYEDILRYYRALAEATPRVSIETIGESDEGRELVVVWVSSDENMASLDRNRENLARIADPRGLSEAEVQRILNTTKPNYHVIGGLHSGETGAPEMLMELAYRVATETSPFVSGIRENVFLSITPVADPDGRDRIVDWFYRGLEREALLKAEEAEKDSVAGEEADSLAAEEEEQAPRQAGLRALLGEVRAPRQQPGHQHLPARVEGTGELVLHGIPPHHARHPRVGNAPLHLQRRPTPEPQPRPGPLR